MGAKKKPAIPSVPVGDKATQHFLNSVKETLEVGTGQRGDVLDRFVTVRELIDAGIVRKLTYSDIYGSDSYYDFAPIVTDDGDLTPPPAPTNLVASGAFTSITLTWDKPTYGNHDKTYIYRLGTDVIGSAISISSTTANIYTDEVGYGQTYYYWVQFESKAGVKGPYNQTAGTQGQTLEDIGAVMVQLTEDITGLNGYSTLINTTIPNLIDTAGSSSTQIIKADAAPTTRNDGSSALQGVDVWVDTNDNNQMYVRNAANNAWVKARDSSLVDLVGLQSGSGAFSGSSLSVAMLTAQSDHSNLATSVTNLSSSLGTKNKLFRQDDAPTDTTLGNTGGTPDHPLEENDLWIDSNDGNKLYYWNDTSNQWVLTGDTRIAGAATSTALDTLTTQTVSTATGVNSLANRLTTLETTVADPSSGLAATVSAVQNANTNITSLQNDKNQTFAQNSAPPNNSTSNLKEGDLWIETDNNNKIYRWSGSTWVDYADGRITATASTLSQLEATVGASGNDVDGNAYSGTNTIAQHLEVTENNSKSSLVLQTDSNGAVAQMILHSEADAGTNPQSVITFRADSFAVSNNSSTDVFPFIVDGGVVYMDTARIKDGAIQNAKLGTVSADKITTGGMNAARITAGTMDFDRIDGNSVTVTNAMIQNAAITNAKLANASIDTAKVGSLYANTLNGDVSKAVAGTLASTVSYQNRSDTFSSAIVELGLAKPTHTNGWNPYAAYNINKVNTEKNSWMYVCLEMAPWNVNSQGGTASEGAASGSATSAFGSGYTGAAITNTFLTGVSGSNANNTVTVSTSVADDVAAGDIVIAGSEERTVVSNSVLFGSRLISYSGNNFSGSPNSFSFKETVSSGNVGKYQKVAEIQWVAVDTAFNDFAISGTFNSDGSAVTHGVKARVRMKGQSTGADQGTLTINITSATGFLMGVR